MATLFIDGFDKYGPPSVTNARLLELMAGEWNNLPSNISVVAALSDTGYALQMNSIGAQMSRTIGTVSRAIAGFRFASNLLNRGGITFYDGATAQCSVTIDPTSGLISLRNGSVSGSIVATSVTSVTAASVHYLECDLTFSNTGAYSVWLDGLLLFSGTGDLTGTANSTADGVGFQCASTGILTVDDFYVFDTTGGVNNAVLNTSPVIETKFPSSDSSVAFAAGNSFVGYGESYTTGTFAAGANKLVLQQVTPPVNMTINSVSLVPAATSAGAKFKGVIYTDTAGLPDSLLDTGTEVVGTVSGTTLVLPATTPQALTGGTPYWIGYITDTSVVIHEADTTILAQTKSNTYGSGAPANATGMTTGQHTLQMWGDCVSATANYTEVDNNAAGRADVSYVSSSNVGDEDLFGFPALSVTPAAVYCVAVKAFCRDTDAGARTIKLHCKSSATDGASGAVAPGTSYGWAGGYFDKDPNGTISWTGTAVNASTAGYKVNT